MERTEIARINFQAMMWEGAFYFTGFTFLDPNSIVPLFIDSYTGNLRLAGLAVTIYTSLMVLAQLLFGPRVPAIKRVPVFLSRLMFYTRPLALLTIPFLLAGFSPQIKVGIFLTAFAVQALGQGMIGIPWMDLLSRTVPGELRGRLLGNQQILAGLGGLISGLVIKLILQSSGLALDVKYSLLFGLGAFFLFGTGCVMSRTRDVPRQPAPARSFLAYCRDLPGYLLANREYRKVVTLQVINALAATVYPFLILFARRRLALPPSQVSLLIYVQIIGKLAGGLLWGAVSHRLGNKYIVVSAGSVALALFALALASPWPGGPFPFIMITAAVFFAGINMLAWIGFTNYVIDVVADEARPVYLVISGILTFPTVFLPFLAGTVAQQTGFTPLFILGLAAALAIFILSFTLKSPAGIAGFRADRLPAPPDGTAAGPVEKGAVSP